MEKEFRTIYENAERIYHALRIELDSSDSFSDELLLNRFIEEMLRVFCNSDKDIKTTRTLNKNKPIIYCGLHGIEPKDYLKCLKDKSLSFYNYGYLGYGCYFTFKMKESYGEKKGDGIVKANLNFENRFANFEDLFDKFNQSVRSLKILSKSDNTLDNEVVDLLYNNRFNPAFVSILAGAKDYNAIAMEEGKGVCVINPKAVTFLDK